MNKESQLKFHAWLAVLAAMVFFIVLINTSRTYKSEVDVIIIPKSEAISKNINQIANDAREIPKTLSFYNQILSENEDIVDEVQELPDYKRKSFWESKIRTKKVDDSSMVKIIVFDGDQERAEDLSYQAGLEIANVMSRYYDIKTEMEIRIADGPIVGYGLGENVFIIISKAVLGGIVASLLVFFINGILKVLGLESKSKGKEFAAASRNFFGAGIKTIKPISFDKKPAGLEKKQPEAEIHPKEKELPDMAKKASAPENLPIGDLSGFENKEIKSGEIKEEEKAEAEKEPIIREATPEEVKERLNKLLKGDL